MEKKKSGFSTAALVLGIIGIVMSIIPLVNFVAYILGALALLFAIVSLIQRASIVKSIISFLLAVAAIAITFNMQSAMVKGIDEAIDSIDSEFAKIDEEVDTMTGENTTDVLKNSVDVELGEFIVEEDEIFTETKLEATIKNKSDKKASFNIEVEAVTEDGERITIDYIYANDLGAGQSQKFKLFTMVEDEKIEALKTAEFKIVSASMY